MSFDINKVILIGRVTNDIQLKQINTGTSVANFGLAVGGKPAKDGKDSVSFFDIIVWGKIAENCKQYLAKGSKLALEGHLEQNRYIAQDGTNRSLIKIVAERVQFLDTKKAENKIENTVDESDFFAEPYGDTQPNF